MIKTNAKEAKKKNIICNFDPHIQKQTKTMHIGSQHHPNSINAWPISGICFSPHASKNKNMWEVIKS